MALNEKQTVHYSFLPSIYAYFESEFVKFIPKAVYVTLSIL